jgi:hypothetical protein
MSNTVSVMPQSQPIVVVNTTQERRPPRIAKGIFVFLVSGIVGLIVFAMGQSVWGAIWRGWLVTAILIGLALLVL